MLAIVIWTAFVAVTYLADVILEPLKLPEPYSIQPLAVLPDDLRAHPGSSAPSKSAIRLTPVGHYHSNPGLIQPLQATNCTTSGCHQPLPHTRNRNTRAFSNFHVTFLDCGLCHHSVDLPTLDAVWVDSRTPGRRQKPAALTLLRLLESRFADIMDRPQAFENQIQDLLRQTLESSADPMLNHLLIQLETSEADSPVWRQAMGQLARELPNHARGNYGARLALKSEPQTASQSNAGTIRQYLVTPKDSPQKNVLLDRIHRSVVSQPPGCQRCHGGAATQIDYQALGYSSSRAAMLRGLPLAGLVRHVQEGQPFYLSTVLEAGDGR